jgi:branched-chain amino acid transport system substrate-binding protein
MNKSRKVGLISLFTLVSFLLVGAVVPLALAKDIKIALIYPVTGPLAHQSQVSIEGHKAAADLINSQGGIKSLGGAKIKYVIADTQYKPDILKSEVQRVVQLEKVSAILGAYDSGSTVMVSQEAKKYKVPMVSGVAAADVLTTQLGHPYFFRYGIRANWIARDMYNTYVSGLKANGMDPGKYNRIALFYMDGKFGQAVAAGCKEWASKFGLNIVADLTYPVAATDLSGSLLKLRNAKPDAVFQGATLNDAILTARGLRQFRINVMGWYAGGGGPSENKFYQSVPLEGEYHHAWTYWHNDLKPEKVRTIDAAFRKQFGRGMDGDTAMAYASTIILADALERAGSTDRDKIRNALAETDLSGDDERLPTIFGAKFDQTGQNEFVEGMLIQNLAGSRYTVYPTKYATRKPVCPIPDWKNR